MSDTTNRIPVLITVPFSDEILATIRDLSTRLDVLYHPAKKTEDVPDELWERAEVLYTIDVLPEKTMAPHLRWIQSHSAGVDHLMTHEMVTDAAIKLSSTSGIHATNIAEYAFMFMLAFGHRLPTMMAYQADANWPEEDRYATFIPVELRGSTLGIVGYGSIGREIARLARAFDMEVLAVKRDVRHPSDTDSYVVPGTGDPEGNCFHRLYPPEALCSMVSVCDFVVVTVPLTDHTRGMFGAAAFEAMKETAYLINVGRGGVVDEKALLAALEAGAIAGAAMDVFSAEPLPADSPLWKQPNLIISPHVSGSARNYNEKAATMFVTNLQRYLKGQELLNLVNKEEGY